MRFRVMVMSFVALCGLALMPSLASAQTGSDAMQQLIRDHVYVSQSANPRLSEGEAADLASTIRDLDLPLYVAIVPESTVDKVGGDYDKLPGYFGNQLERPAVVAVIAGKHFRAGSSSGVGLAKGQAGSLADQAFDEENPGQNGGDIYPMLDRYAHLVADARADGSSTTTGSASSPSSGSDIAWWALGIIAVLIFIIVAMVAIAASSNRRRLRQQCEAKLQACAEDVVALDAETTLDDEKKGYYEQGVTAYNQANEAFSSATSKYELTDVLDTLTTAQRCFQRARGIIATAPTGGRYSHGPWESYSAETEDDEPRAVRRGNGYYYGGGYRGGVYYQPGYYDSDRFWEGMFLGQMLADDHHHHHDHDDDRGSWSGGSSSDDSYDPPDSGGGNWGSDDSSTDFGGSTDFGSSFDSGSFDSGSSGGGDW